MPNSIDRKLYSFFKKGVLESALKLTGGLNRDTIDLSGVTYVPTGSNGPCLIRAGTYANPLAITKEAQSGLIRLYAETNADGTSYDRGVFVCLKTTGKKNIFPIAGLAEVLAQASTGPTAVMAAQFICHLNSATAKLATSASATDGMFAAWLKITANDGATVSTAARVAPLWLDNQLYGANASNALEYTIYNTTGGSVPKAWAAFSTSGAGWAQLLYFDATMATVVPFVATGCSVTVATVPYLKVLIGTQQYGIPLIAIGA